RRRLLARRATAHGCHHRRDGLISEITAGRVEMPRPAVAMVFAALAALATITALTTRSTAQSPFGHPHGEPGSFKPQMSALMSMLIQPRHAKLGLAGKEENWPLAAYALKELKQGFFVAARAVPRWKGLPVADLFDAAVGQPLALLDFAIKANEPRQFGESYAKLTAGCNACHGTTDHVFVVITAPDSAAAFPNQDFRPKR